LESPSGHLQIHEAYKIEFRLPSPNWQSVLYVDASRSSHCQTLFQEIAESFILGLRCLRSLLHTVSKLTGASNRSAGHWKVDEGVHDAAAVSWGSSRSVSSRPPLCP
jgi:hypothetical protein